MGPAANKHGNIKQIVEKMRNEYKSYSNPDSLYSIPTKGFESDLGLEGFVRYLLKQEEVLLPYLKRTRKLDWGRNSVTDTDLSILETIEQGGGKMQLDTSTSDSSAHLSESSSSSSTSSGGNKEKEKDNNNNNDSLHDFLPLTAADRDPTLVLPADKLKTSRQAWITCVQGTTNFKQLIQCVLVLEDIIHSLQEEDDHDEEEEERTKKEIEEKEKLIKKRTKLEGSRIRFVDTEKKEYADGIILSVNTEDPNLFMVKKPLAPKSVEK